MDSRKEFSAMISCAAARGENPEIFARSGAAARASAAENAKAAANRASPPRPLERRRRASRSRQMSFLQIADGLFQSVHEHLNLRRRDRERGRN